LFERTKDLKKIIKNIQEDNFSKKSCHELTKEIGKLKASPINDAEVFLMKEELVIKRIKATVGFKESEQKRKKDARKFGIHPITFVN
jgi:hypothetical protein